jgi:hypothetical protein
MLSQTCRREEQERRSQQYGWAFDLLHSELAFLSWLRLRTPEKGITWPKVRRLAKPAELADLQGDSEEEGRSLNHAASMTLPASWYRWQFSGTQKDLYSARKIRVAFAREFRGNAWFDYAEPRAIPSLCILNCRVDRFIARSAAAPWGPATTQLHSLRAFRICWRSVSCKRF